MLIVDDLLVLFFLGHPKETLVELDKDFFGSALSWVLVIVLCHCYRSVYYIHDKLGVICLLIQ